MEWSMREVVSSQRPLASLALEGGFADHSHFTRTFRRAFGVTPARLRRQRGQRG
jgi:AraC-like DNA-binding protein